MKLRCFINWVVNVWGDKRESGHRNAKLKINYEWIFYSNLSSLDTLHCFFILQYDLQSFNGVDTMVIIIIMFWLVVSSWTDKYVSHCHSLTHYCNYYSHVIYCFIITTSHSTRMMKSTYALWRVTCQRSVNVAYYYLNWKHQRRSPRSG